MLDSDAALAVTTDEDKIACSDAPDAIQGDVKDAMLCAERRLKSSSAVASGSSSAANASYNPGLVTSKGTRKRARIVSNFPNLDDASVQSPKRLNPGSSLQTAGKSDRGCFECTETGIESKVTKIAQLDPEEKHTLTFESETLMFDETCKDDPLGVLTDNVVDLGITDGGPSRPGRASQFAYEKPNISDWEEVSAFEQADVMGFVPNAILDSEAWSIGDINVDILNQGTEYLQLLEHPEPEVQQTVKHTSPNSLQEFVPGSANNMSPAESSTVPEAFDATKPMEQTALSIESKAQSTTVLNQEQRAELVKKPAFVKLPCPSTITTTPNAEDAASSPAHYVNLQRNQTTHGPTQEADGNICAPDIETRIITPQTFQAKLPSTGGTAVRIAPREKLTSEPSCIGQSLPVRARSKSRANRTRQSASQAVQSFDLGKPSEQTASLPSPFGQQNNAFQGSVKYPGSSPAVPSPATVMSASRKGSTPESSASLPLPHPMAAPIMFAQGFSPANGADMPVSFLVPGPNNGSSATSHGSIAQSLQFLRPTAPNMSPNAVPVPSAQGSSNQMAYPQNALIPPMMSPGVVPVDPSAWKWMMQQMWNAVAVAAQGTSPPGTSQELRLLPFGAPGFLNSSLSVSNAAPRFSSTNGSGPTASPSDRNRNGVPTPHTVPGKGRPIYIPEDGKHVVVEQQAPAKLMRHPVLGRLQLQSKQQAVVDHNGNGSGAAYAVRTVCGKMGAGDEKRASESQGGASSKERRKRLVWTPELHERFVHAINSIGIHQAVPKTLVQIMNVEGLTTEHVKSHLQKYRNSLRKAVTENNRVKVKPIIPPNRQRLLAKTEAGDKLMGVRTVPIPFSRSSKHNSVEHTNSSSGSKVTTRIVQVANQQAQVNAEAGPNCSSDKPSKTPLVAEKASAESRRSNEATQKTDSQSDADKKVAMQERTMELQYQLQVMVVRTVDLKKKLQLMIEKQQCFRGKQVATSAVEGGGGSGSVDGSQGGCGVEDIEAMMKEQLEMKQELDRKIAMMQQELGKMQKQLGHDNEEEGPLKISESSKMKLLDRRAAIVSDEIGAMDEQLDQSASDKICTTNIESAGGVLSAGVVEKT